MNFKKYLIISLLITIVCYFCTAFVYCFLFFRSYSPEFVRDIDHFYSGISLVFIYSLIFARPKNTPIKKGNILCGVICTLSLTIFWEILFQGTSGYHNGHGFYVQWEQIIADILGVAVASIAWLIKRRRFLF